MSKCKFCPEITNCVECEYFDIVETDTDFKVVCLKYEEELNRQTEDLIVAAVKQLEKELNNYGNRF